jgi:hypothetical protein
MTPTEENLFTITDVTPEEIFAIAVLLGYAKKFNSTIAVKWVDDFLLLRISRLRIGRKELLMLGSGMRREAERKRGSATDLFAGLQ